MASAMTSRINAQFAVQNHMQKGLEADLALHAPGKVPSSNAALMTGFFLEWSKNALKSA
jgi:hypothetical protein